MVKSCAVQSMDQNTSNSLADRGRVAIQKLSRYGGMSQSEIGRLLEISQSSTAKIYYGHAVPRRELLQRLEEAAETARKNLLAEAAADAAPQPIQLYSCFVSYATADEPFAE